MSQVQVKFRRNHGDRIKDYIAQISASDDSRGIGHIQKSTLQQFLKCVSNPDPFPIDLQFVIEWLEIGKTKNGKPTRRDPQSYLKEKLQCYQQGVDWNIVGHRTSGSQGGRPREQIRLSASCFKRLLMRLHKPKCEEIRTYFILVEELYRERMLQAIGKRHSKEEENVLQDKMTNRTKTNFPRGKGVYIVEIQHNDTRTYKIGLADEDVNTRYQELQSIYPGK